MVGLGRMGANMAHRLALGGHHVVVYNRTTQKALDLTREVQGITVAREVEDLATALSPRRAVWMMLPAGAATETMLGMLLTVLSKTDVIVDGGNANYRDTMRRAEAVKAAGLCYVDVGTSGGIWGLEGGYSIMVGGERSAVEHLRPALETLAPAPDKGWGHVGPSGAGHFVKMVHNGVEYGLMQAYAEGFEILHKKDFGLDLRQISNIWRYGSVVRSWLLDLIAAGLEHDRELSAVTGWVADSGEGRWTVAEAIDLDVPAPVITLALQMRFISRQEGSYAAKLLAVMREEFGGHAVKRLGDIDASRSEASR